MRNHNQLQAHNKTLISASVNAIKYPPSTRSSNWSLSHNSLSKAAVHPLYCSNCVGNWLPNHRDKCLAKGKTCKNCWLLNHFSKVCRIHKNQKLRNPKKRSVKTVDDEPHPEDCVDLLYSSSKFYKSDYKSGDDNMVATIHNDLKKLEPINMVFGIGSFSITLLVGSGNACSRLN